jgi:hypothetical protein
MQTPITAREITDLVGDIDPAIAVSIAATGASFDEVAEALAQVEDEADLGELVHQPSSARVVEVRHILQDVIAPDDEDDTIEMPIT